MQCLQARLQLRAGLERGQSIAADPALAAHLQDCAVCRVFCLEQLLDGDSQAMEVPPHSADFVDRVIANAIRQGQPQRRFGRYGGAVAAALVVGVATAILVKAARFDAADTAGSAQQVALVPHEVHPVRLMIDSTADRDDATVSIELAENLELAGYPEQHRLSWKTDLQRGRNLLSLPLVLQDASNSYVKVTYSYGSIQKQIEVVIRSANAPLSKELPESKKPLG
jgi:hypothetical protein